MKRGPRPGVLILAGGMGSRCGDRDKGWLEIRGEALIQRRLCELSSSAWTCGISANRNLERYRALGAPVFVDATPGFSGPLAGVEAALSKRFGNPVISVPVDAPRVSIAVLRRLLDASEGGSRAAFACDADGVQPLVAVWPASALPALVAAQRSENRSVRGLQQRLMAVRVDFPFDRFGNVNTLAELEMLACESMDVATC